MAGNKDIDLILVTGAGASREFGVTAPLPLMGGWSKFLLEKLSRDGISYPELIGLEPGLSGEKFEEALGEFLRRAVAFDFVKPFIRTSTNLPNVTGIQVNSLENWYDQVGNHLRRIVDLVRESVVDQFHRDQINVLKAAKAYDHLLERLRISTEARLVYATTNYDPVGEYALAELGRLPDCGEPATAMYGGGSGLQTKRLLDGMPRYTPVLHLHGKVGWYRRSENGQVYSIEVKQHRLWLSFGDRRAAIKPARERVCAAGRDWRDRTSGA